PAPGRATWPLPLPPSCPALSSSSGSPLTLRSACPALSSSSDSPLVLPGLPPCSPVCGRAGPVPTQNPQFGPQKGGRRGILRVKLRVCSPAGPAARAEPAACYQRSRRRAIIGARKAGERVRTRAPAAGLPAVVRLGGAQRDGHGDARGL